MDILFEDSLKEWFANRAKDPELDKRVKSALFLTRLFSTRGSAFDELQNAKALAVNRLSLLVYVFGDAGGVVPSTAIDGDLGFGVERSRQKERWID
ncbi:hypothetical protein Tco_0580488 [Tanacetum coccineum]